MEKENQNYSPYWLPSQTTEWIVGLSMAVVVVLGMWLGFGKDISLFDGSSSSDAEEVVEEVAEETAPAQTALEGFCTLEGTMGRSSAIRMSITVTGGQVSGSYVYVKYNTPISLEGSYSAADNKLEIYEYDNYGSQHGKFDGYVSGTTYSGTFTNFENYKETPFTLNIQ